MQVCLKGEVSGHLKGMWWCDTTSGVVGDLCVVLPLSYPNLKSVRELIYKRGYGKIKKQRIPLTDNSLIEKSLGKNTHTHTHTDANGVNIVQRKGLKHTHTICRCQANLHVNLFLMKIIISKDQLRCMKEDLQSE